MLDSGIYIGECVLFSSRYNGEAVAFSMQGCSLSTTHIQMILTPNEQKSVIEWFYKHKRQMVEEVCSDFQNQKELWCGNCGFKESETCNDEITWKRCRLMSSEPEGSNVEDRLELARSSAVEKVLDKLEQLLCAHHKYVGSYRVITGTNEEIYDEMFDAMQEFRKSEPGSSK